MRGTLSAIDRGCLMTDLTYFAQQSCAFTLQFQFRDQAKSGDRVILKAPAPAVQFMNFSAPPLSCPSAHGSTTILVSPRERQESLLLVFTGCSITLSSRPIFLEIHSPHSPPGSLHTQYLSYENLELSDSPILLACPGAGTGKTL